MNRIPPGNPFAGVGRSADSEFDAAGPSSPSGLRPIRILRAVREEAAALSPVRERSPSPDVSCESDQSGVGERAGPPRIKPLRRPTDSVKLLQSELTRKLSLARMSPEAQLHGPLPPDLVRQSIEAQVTGVAEAAQSPARPGSKRSADEEEAFTDSAISPMLTPVKRPRSGMSQAFHGSSPENDSSDVLGHSAPW